MSAKSNNRVTCDSDPNFYLRYKNVSVGSPQTFTENMTREDITPQQCRLRDMTYAAPLMVDVEYTKGREISRFFVAIAVLLFPLAVLCSQVKVCTYLGNQSGTNK